MEASKHQSRPKPFLLRFLVFPQNPLTPDVFNAEHRVIFKCDCSEWKHGYGSKFIITFLKKLNVVC